MENALFYLFAAATVLCGLLVVVNPWSRNPVTSAMFLVLAMVSLSGLFVLLHAFFLAAVQILVYAGAVVVLFLFVIMLLDLKDEEKRSLSYARAGMGLIGAGAVTAFLVGTVRDAKSIVTTPSLTEGGAASLGKLLFTDYVLPFEIMSLLLLVGMVGVVLLSKKELK